MAIVVSYIDKVGDTRFYIETFKGESIYLPFSAKRMAYDRATKLQQATIPYVTDLSDGQMDKAYEVAYPPIQ